jgi:hypothetical protein
LKNALVLCLNDEYADSTRLLSQKGSTLYLRTISSRASLSQGLYTANVGSPQQHFKNPSMESFLDG